MSWMRLGWRVGIGAALWLSIIAGCVGESPELVSSSQSDAGDAGAATPEGGVSDAGTDSSIEADAPPTDAAPCDAIPGNLLTNDSFESGGASWNATSALTKRTDGPAHCLAYVEVHTIEAYGGLDQHFDLAASDAGGPVTVEFGVSLRGLDDTLAPVFVILANDADTVSEIVLSPMLKANGEWVAASGTVTVPPGPSFYLRIQSEQIRRFGVDRAWVTRND